MIKDIQKLRKEGKSDTEIGKELDISRQKVGAIVKKHEYEAANKVEADEFPAEMYAKSSNVIREESMGGSIIMTAREYQEYSADNGRYQGRRENQKTKLDPLELRVAITCIARGDRSGVETREHLKAKHGLTDDDIRKAAYLLTKEEEVTMREILRPLGLKVKG